MSKLIHTKRLLALVMAVLLIVSLVPVSAFAETSYTLTGLQSDGLQTNSATEHLIKFNGTNMGNPDTLVLKPTETSNVQLIRNAVTYNIGAPGQDTLAIWGGGNNGYIKVSEYYSNLSNGGSGYKAPEQGDVFVVSGTFQTADGATTVSVETTYITVGADNALTFSTEKPVIETVLQLSGLQSDGLQTNSATEHLIKFNGTNMGNPDILVLQPTETSNVQLIRNGVTYNIGAPGQDTLVIWGGGNNGYIKVSEYYSNLSQGGSGYKAPEAGDVFIVQGAFKAGNTKVVVETTYITVGADNALTFSTEAPVIDSTPHLTGLQSNGLRAESATAHLINFTCTNFGNSEDLVFQPTEASNVQLIRYGKTYNIGATGQDTLVIWGGGSSGYIKVSEFYSNLSQGGSGYKAPQEGDIFIVQGTFRSGDTEVVVETTYITVGEDNALIFSTEAPVIDSSLLYLIGLQNNNLKENSATEHLINFQGASCGNEGALVLQPTDPSNVQLIRYGKTYSIGAPGQDTLAIWGGGNSGYIKVSEFYSNLSQGGSGYKAPQEGDVFVVRGIFQTADGNSKVFVQTTYVTVGAENVLTFSTEKPDVSCNHSKTTQTTVEATFEAAGYIAVTCDNCGEEISRTELAQLSGAVKNWNITLCDNIQLNFNLTVSVPDVANAKVQVNVAGVQKQYALSELPCEDDVYSLSVELAAAQMTETVSVSFLYGECTSAASDYTVRGYADRILTGAYSQATKALVREMLSYGGAAQEYFGYHSDNLASNGITDTATAEITDSCTDMSVSGKVENVAFYGASMVYRDRIAIRFYFAGDVSGCTFKIVETNQVEGTNQVKETYFEAAEKNGLSYVEISGILPQDLDQQITLTVTSGDSNMNVSYSPLNYIVRMNAKDDASLKGLLKALYNYHLAAQAYLTAPSTIVVEGGTLAENEMGFDLNQNLIYVSLEETDLPGNADDGVIYTAEEGVIKLVRGGQTIALSGNIVKYENGEGYDFNLLGDVLPLQNYDYLIVEGNFANTDNNYTLRISKTYVLYSNDALTFGTEAPVVPSDFLKLEGLKAKENNYKLDGSIYQFHFNGTSAGNQGLLSLYATSANNIQLVRDGVTTGISGTGSDSLIIWAGGADGYIKVSQYLANLANANLDPSPKTGDIYIIQGDFKTADGKTMVTVEKTYIICNEDSVTIGTELPKEPSEKLTLTGMKSDVLEKQNDGSYLFKYNGASLQDAATSAAYQNAVTLRPTKASNILLVRGDNTYKVAAVGQDTLVVWSGNNGYIKHSQYLAQLADNSNSGIDVAPKAGDILIIEGDFKTEDGEILVTVEKTYIQVGENNSITIGTTSPHYINGGHMIANETTWHEKQTGTTTPKTGIYFKLSNDISALPFASDWSVEYAPTSVDCVKLVRNGVTQSVGRLGAGTLIPVGGGVLWLKLESWTITSFEAGESIADGDIVIIEGDFVNNSNGYTVHVDKTYVKFDLVNQTVLFSTQSENTEFGDIILPTSEDTINYGVWVGSYHVFTDDKLAELQAAGITRLIGIDPQWIGTESSDENGNISMNVFLDRCQKYGISVIAQLSSRTDDLAGTDESKATFKENGVRYSSAWDGKTVPDYANHPALLGVILYDEPSTKKFSSIAETKKWVETNMPGKLAFVNLLCDGNSKTMLYGSELVWGQDYVTDYVGAFLSQVQPEVLSWDHYVLLKNNGIRTKYYRQFEIMAHQSVTKWYTMLSSGHNTTSTSFNTPTAEELRWQMAVSLTYGVSDINHYTYVSHESDYSCMIEWETWKTTPLYTDIKNVDNEYLSWGNIYKAYSYLGTSAVNVNDNPMFTELKNSLDLTAYGLQNVSTTEDLLVGVFDNNGNKAYMITNAGKVGSTTVGDGKDLTMTDTTATLTLENSQQYKCVAVISKGEITYMVIGADGTVQIPVGAYEGVFVIPVLN